jgi:hypothetical protein
MWVQGPFRTLTTTNQWGIDLILDFLILSMWKARFSSDRSSLIFQYLGFSIKAGR